MHPCVEVSESAGVGFGELETLFRRKTQELADLRTIHANAKQGLEAQGLTNRAKQSIQRVRPGRQRAELDPRDRRLWDVGEPAQLALGKP